jgi:hypothetical protein
MDGHYCLHRQYRDDNYFENEKSQGRQGKAYHGVQVIVVDSVGASVFIVFKYLMPAFGAPVDGAVGFVSMAAVAVDFARLYVHRVSLFFYFL